MFQDVSSDPPRFPHHLLTHISNHHRPTTEHRALLSGFLGEVDAQLVFLQEQLGDQGRVGNQPRRLEGAKGEQG